MTGQEFRVAVKGVTLSQVHKTLRAFTPGHSFGGYSDGGGRQPGMSKEDIESDIDHGFCGGKLLQAVDVKDFKRVLDQDVSNAKARKDKALLRQVEHLAELRAEHERSIFGYERIDRDEAAAGRLATRNGEIIVVEPGDATHYELRVDKYSRTCVAVVGALDDRDSSGVLVMAFNTRGPITHPFGRYAERTDPTA